MESIFLTLRRQSLGGPNALTGIPFVTENVPSSVIEPLIRNGAVLIGKTSQSRYSSSARLVSGKYVAFAVSQSDFTMTEQNAAVFHSLYSFSEISELPAEIGSTNMLIFQCTPHEIHKESSIIESL